MEKTWKRKASRIIVIEKIMDNHARALPKVLRSKTKVVQKPTHNLAWMLIHAFTPLYSVGILSSEHQA